MAADHGESGRSKPTEEIEQLKKRLSEQTNLAEERLERLKYLQAEFDNFRKWSEKEKRSVIDHANENLITDLLVILDDFEQSLPSLENEKNRIGVRMVYQKMVKILLDYGLEPIECIGEKSDPLLHDVICRKQCSDEPGTIVEEIGKGYSLKSKVIRPSKVMVAENISKHEGEING
jgi:molecular chaperone GrpE